MAYVEPLRTKAAPETARGMNKIIKRLPYSVETVAHDSGKEWMGAFKALLKKSGIRQKYQVTSRHKAAIVERLNLTLRRLLTKYLAYNNTKRYLGKLQDLVALYNNQFNRSLGMAPAQLNTRNSYKAFIRSYTSHLGPVSKQPSFRIGDKVRLSVLHPLYKKLSTSQSFTDEIFLIHRVIRRQNMYVYHLSDISQTEVLEGISYPHELIRVTGKLRARPQSK
jgi:hypothetical protein